MPNWLLNILPDWFTGWPIWLQEVSFTLLLLLPALIVGLVLLRGFRPLPLVRALMRRYIWVNAVFVLLIAVSLGLGIGLLAQERGLRRGTAAAAEKFDMIISAPGDELTMMMASVFLQPSNVPLLDGYLFEEIYNEPRGRSGRSAGLWRQLSGRSGGRLDRRIRRPPDG